MIFGILRHKKYRQTRFSGSARFFVPFTSFPLYPRDSAVQPRPGPADRPRPFDQCIGKIFISVVFQI